MNSETIKILQKGELLILSMVTEHEYVLSPLVSFRATKMYVVDI